MSPTITTSSEANGNVSAATARAAASAASVAEASGPQAVTMAKALNTALADVGKPLISVLPIGATAPVVEPVETNDNPVVVSTGSTDESPVVERVETYREEEKAGSGMS